MICAICDRAALNCELTPEAGWVCPSCLDNSDLRAGITRAENDLTEARQLARELAWKQHPVWLKGALSRYPWLTEAE